MLIRLLVTHTLNVGIGMILVSDLKEKLCLHHSIIMSPGSNRSHESLIAPETIDVDDISHANSGNSSPDELNIRSLSTEGAFLSRFGFDAPSHGSTVRNNNPHIVPDGENTEWAKKKYSHVGERVAKIEAKSRMADQSNMMDLRTKTKNKMKPKVCPPSHRAG